MGISVKIQITGARETLAAFRKLPKDATVEMRDANQHISEDLADKIRQAATADGAQSALVASSVKARRDRVPSVQAGGKGRAGSQKRRSKGQKPTNMSDLLYGANFGANVLKQFHKPTQPDHWFFDTVEANEARIVKDWEDAAERVLGKWARG